MDGRTEAWTYGQTGRQRVTQTHSHIATQEVTHNQHKSTKMQRQTGGRTSRWNSAVRTCLATASIVPSEAPLAIQLHANQQCLFIFYSQHSRLHVVILRKINKMGRARRMAIWFNWFDLGPARTKQYGQLTKHPFAVSIRALPCNFTVGCNRTIRLYYNHKIAHRYGASNGG